MPFAPQGLDRVAAWKSALGDVPLVAIGGITLDRVIKVLEAGADSAAVITDIVTAQDPESQARCWLAATAPQRQLSTVNSGG
jgi:thiamine-phosphate pyrophosphorylase